MTVEVEWGYRPLPWGNGVISTVSPPVPGKVPGLDKADYHTPGPAGRCLVPLAGLLDLLPGSFYRMSIREAVITFWSYLPRMITRCPSLRSSTLPGLFRAVNFV